MWDPGRYLQFADQRSRPFADLVGRIGASDPAEVADLGCGPGNLTATLATRWPRAHVVAVDSSPEMLATARGHDGIEVVEADVRTWAPAGSVDVLVSNATLQWVPEQLELLPRWASFLSGDGWLAVQVPANFAEPSHVLLRELAASPQWRLEVAWPESHEPSVYLEALMAAGLEPDVWETTYLHVLTGEDAVLDWMSGTGLRPVLAELDGAARDEFVAAYAARLRAAYPARAGGTVLPYRRVFAVGRKGTR